MEKIFFVGVGGIGMSGVAGIAKEMGYEVAGSEKGTPFSPASEVLKSLNIPLFSFSEQNILNFKPDYVVVGNAINKNHEEVKKCQELNIPLYSFPQFLENFVFHDKKILVCAGTHGKTTSSALLGYVLEKAGLDPTYLIGGVFKHTLKNYRKGSSIWCVVEGDEYPSSFFDPFPKFFHYKPFALLLTSLEHDHVDVYPQFHNLKEIFIELVKKVPEDGLIVYNRDDSNLSEIIKIAKPRAKTFSYGRSKNTHYTLIKSKTFFEKNSFKTQVTLKTYKGEELTFTVPLLGEHNALNTTGVFAILDSLNLLKPEDLYHFETFPGIKRRHEVVFFSDNLILIDDFAHHPTEVKVTLKALIKVLNPDTTVLIFEPRTNTSKRKIFQERYIEALSLADVIYLKKPPNLELIPTEERIDLIKLSQTLQKKGKKVYFLDEGFNFVDFIDKKALLVFMSSASLEKEINHLLVELKHYNERHTNFINQRKR